MKYLLSKTEESRGNEIYILVNFAGGDEGY